MPVFVRMDFIGIHLTLFVKETVQIYSIQIILKFQQILWNVFVIMDFIGMLQVQFAKEIVL
jgi:hypothetical protein